MFDDASFKPGTQYYTIESLGTSQELTPEGFLLCKNVPVSRTGSQLYGPGEVPVAPGRDGLIHITRDEADVFHPATLASFQGKPIVNEHPDDKVTPDTWKHHALGVVLNPRRGDGMQFDNNFTYCDMLIQDKDAIAAVRDGKREVSVGYDASYEDLGNGRGRQHNIIVNHVALVDRGRCGPRCAIGDKDMARLHVFKDRIRRAIYARDEAGVLNAVQELSKDPELLGEVLSGDEGLSPEGFTPSGLNDERANHHVTINIRGGEAKEVSDAPPDAPAAGAPPDPAGAPPDAGGGGGMAEVLQRLDQLEQVVSMIAERMEGGGEEADYDPEPEPEAQPEASPEGNDDSMVHDRAIRRRATVGDSSKMQQSFTTMLSQAELIMPGIGLVTFDSAAPAKATFDAMCGFKRKTLEAAAKNTERADNVKVIMGGRLPKTFLDKATMTCDQIDNVFNGASALAAQQNRGRAFQPQFGNNGQPNGFSAKPLSPADLNARNNEFYAQHTKH